MSLAASSRRRLSLLRLRRFSSSAAACDGTVAPYPAFDSSICRLARLRSFSDIESILEPLKRDPRATASEPFLASIVASYASSGMVDHAVRTLGEYPGLGVPRTALSFNALLYALNRTPDRFGRRRLVPDLFADLPSKISVVPDKVSYGILIKSHCLAGESGKAFLVLRQMEEKKIEASTVVYTTIIDSLYKEGKPEDAERLWKEMESKGLEPDLPAYNVRVMHRALNGKPKEVLDLIEEMDNADRKPDMITYNYLMACYCNHGRFEDAKMVYKGLDEKGCIPNAKTFKILVTALCKNEDFNTALEIFMDSMKQSKVPDLSSVKLLIDGLVKTGKLRAAKRIVSGLKKKFPEDFVGDWKKLEKAIDLNTDAEDTEKGT